MFDEVPPGIDPEKLAVLRAYYEAHDTSDEMEDGEWVNLINVDEYMSNVTSLPDGYDDYRIDDVVGILDRMYTLFKSRTWVDIHDFNKIADKQVGEFYDENYWERR